jgi:hypothetical protein
LQSFETELLTQPENLAALPVLNRELIARAEAIDSSRRVVLDMDSTEIPVYGRQEDCAYNGHFESVCYHPLLLFNGEGDCLAVKLRPGNVHSAEGWDELLLPELERLQAQGIEVAFRGDAAFAKPEIYEALEARAAKYAIRLPANDKMERNITELLRRPPGRPSYRPLIRYQSLLYRAASWTKARRVVAKVEFHCGELFPRGGFIVTNLTASNRTVVRFYNKRGTGTFSASGLVRHDPLTRSAAGLARWGPPGASPGPTAAALAGNTFRCLPTQPARFPCAAHPCRARSDRIPSCCPESDFAASTADSSIW